MRLLSSQRGIQWSTVWRRKRPPFSVCGARYLISQAPEGRSYWRVDGLMKALKHDEPYLLTCVPAVRLYLLSLCSWYLKRDEQREAESTLRTLINPTDFTQNHTKISHIHTRTHTRKRRRKVAFPLNFLLCVSRLQGGGGARAALLGRPRAVGRRADQHGHLQRIQGAGPPASPSPSPSPIPSPYSLHPPLPVSPTPSRALEPPHRGTSLLRNSASLAPYGTTLPRAIWLS